MTSEGRLVRLTNADFNLLVVLLASPQRIFTRDQLLDLSRLHSSTMRSSTAPSMVQIMRLLEISTSTLQSDIYAHIFDQKGLMGGIALQGMKIIKINR